VTNHTETNGGKKCWCENDWKQGHKTARPKHFLAPVLVLDVLLDCKQQLLSDLKQSKYTSDRERKLPRSHLQCQEHDCMQKDY